MESVMTVAEVAEALKVSKGSVRKLAHSKELPYTMIAGKMRFLEKDVMALLRKDEK